MAGYKKITESTVLIPGMRLRSSITESKNYDNFVIGERGEVKNGIFEVYVNGIVTSKFDLEFFVYSKTDMIAKMLEYWED